MKQVFISILLCLLLFSCKENRPRTTTGGWQLSGLPSDSLLERLDRAILSYRAADSIKALSSRYIAALDTENPAGRYDYRIPYIKGTALFMSGEFEKGDSLRREGIALCDSAKFPQDFAMMRLGVEQPDEFPDGVSRYTKYSTDLNGFIHNGDNVNAATRAVQLSALMCEHGLPDKGLEYALTADSLLCHKGLGELRNNYRINLASAYMAMGDTCRALGILDEVSTYPSATANPVIRGIAAFNKSNITGKPEDLKAAWSAIAGNPDLARFRGLMAAALINHSSDFMTDSLKNALVEAEEYAYLPLEQLEISRGRLNVAIQQGTYSGIKHAAERYDENIREYLENARSGEVAALEFQAEISRIEKAHAEAKETRDHIIILLATGMVLVTGILYACYRRHLHIADKTAMLQVMDALARKQDTAVAALGEIPTRKDNEFAVLFAGRYPKVSKTGRKIATLIREGKDVSSIAMELNIRKESVLQARWRLRMQMGLTPEEDLDTTIQRL